MLENRLNRYAMGFAGSVELPKGLSIGAGARFLVRAPLALHFTLSSEVSAESATDGQEDFVEAEIDVHSIDLRIEADMVPTLGIQWDFGEVHPALDGLRLGVAARGEASMDIDVLMDGQINFGLVDAGELEDTTLALVYRSQVHVLDHYLPAQIQSGLAYRPTPSLDMYVDAQLTQWSSMELNIAQIEEAILNATLADLSTSDVRDGNAIDVAFQDTAAFKQASPFAFQAGRWAPVSEASSSSHEAAWPTNPALWSPNPRRVLFWTPTDWCSRWDLEGSTDFAFGSQRQLEWDAYMQYHTLASGSLFGTRLQRQRPEPQERASIPIGGRILVAGFQALSILMGTTWLQLAEWACALTAESVPTDVLRRATLQHISTAGTVRSVQDWPVPKIDGSRARQWATRSALLDHADHFFWSPSACLSACASLEAPKGRTALDSLVATVVGNEISARMGLANFFESKDYSGVLRLQCLAVAATRAKTLGLDPATTAHAYALALEHCPLPKTRISSLATEQRATLYSQCFQRGMEAAEAARDGATASDSSPPGNPLAFTALGSCWLTRSLAYSLQPGHLLTRTAVEAIQEILRRHVKAADKRLRPDQVDRIEIRVPAPTMALAASLDNGPLDPAGFCADIRRQVGLLVATHDLSAASHSPESLETHRERIEFVAERVHLEHDWTSTLRFMEASQNAFGGLYSDSSWADLSKRFRTNANAVEWKAGWPPVDQWMSLIKARPDRFLKRARQVQDLRHTDDRAIRFCLPVEVKVFTTRGGWWPERRECPEGSPGWNLGSDSRRGCSKVRVRRREGPSACPQPHAVPTRQEHHPLDSKPSPSLIVE